MVYLSTLEVSLDVVLCPVSLLIALSKLSATTFQTHSSTFKVAVLSCSANTSSIVFLFYDKASVMVVTSTFYLSETVDKSRVIAWIDLFSLIGFQLKSVILVVSLILYVLSNVFIYLISFRVSCSLTFDMSSFAMDSMSSFLSFLQSMSQI